MKKYDSINPESVRIIIITQGVSMIVNPLLKSHHKVIGIIESAPRKKIKRLIINIAVKVYGIFSNKDRSLKSLALKRNIPYYYMDNGCDFGLESWVKNLNPDIIVVYSMSELLKDNIIKIPKFGAINLHPSLLPKYRGPNPYFWLYYNMDLNAGISVHFISSKEDVGDIILQKKIGMKLGTKKDVLIGKISKEGPNLVLKSIEGISHNRFSKVKQPNFSPTLRARNVKIDEYESIIKWGEWDVKRVWHFLGGTEEFIVSLTEFDDLIKRGVIVEVLNFRKCKIHEEKYSISHLYKEKGRHVLICRDGKIYLNIKFSIIKFLKSLIIS